MKVVIAGSRHMPDQDYSAVVSATERFVRDFGPITEVVSGRAKGADRLGERWAEEAGLPCKCFPADWKFFGKAAGPIRNEAMARYADALIAFLYPGSRGTLNMIRQMKKLGKPVLVVQPAGPVSY